MRRVLSALFFIVLLASPSFAYEAAYVGPEQVDLAKLLAPPPAPQSQEQQLDLEEVLLAQERRTPQQADRAVADNNTSVYRIAQEVLGPNFTSARVPKFDAFYKRVVEDTRVVSDASKNTWNRPRPYKVSSAVKMIGELPRTVGSYPSGHSMRGYMAAIILANMAPEKSAGLFGRGREYGMNRVVVGVHFPTDVEGGRIGATAITAAFMQNEKYKKDFAEAKAELRQALGLMAAQ